LETTFKYSELSRRMEEASNVQLLTVLASIFLPLSLGCGLLSMQTRFADLHLLLYDFCGVIFLVGTLAIVIFLLLKLTLGLKEKLAKREAGNSRKRRSGNIIRLVVIVVLVLQWIMVTASFLVGMLKSVSLGLKVLGFGSAALAGLVLIGVVLGFMSGKFTTTRQNGVASAAWLHLSHL
jgi:hypothetical protein